MASRRLAIAVFCAFFLPLFFRGESSARKVAVTVPALNMVAIPFTAAKTKGYYQEEGLEVEIVWISATVAAQALIGGNVEFSTVSGATLPAIVRGAPLKFILTSFTRPMFWIYSRPDIRDIKALKGKKVGVSGVGSGPAQLLNEMLKRHGLEGGRDVALIALGVQPNQFSAMQSGVIDAFTAAPPYNVLAKEAGFHELVSFLKEDFVELQGSVILRDEFLRSEGALVQRFVRATLKGLHYARERRNGTAAILAHYLKIAPDLAARYYDSVRGIMTPDGTASDDLQKRFLDFGVLRAGLKETPPLEKAFDYSLTRKLNTELKAAGWRPED
jgi:NitT/TauT family transport system substrate-binding protein